jgi:uncharacterized protein (UPF0332 family)
MTTWRDIAMENEQAAKELLRAGHYRSAVSRAYYAAFASINDCLVNAGTVRTSDRQALSHRALPAMVEGNISGLATWQRRDLKASARRLYELRLDADYRASVVVDWRVAKQSLSELGKAMRLLAGRSQ